MGYTSSIFSSSRVVSLATGVLPALSNGEIVDLVGYATTFDGYRRTAVYSSGSSLTVDNVFVFDPPPNQAGRLIVAERDLLDLEYAGLSNNASITTLLTAAAANFAGNVVRIRLPRSLTNLTCGNIVFPTGLKRFEVLAGNCTITQIDDNAETMWEIPNPQNVLIEAGVRFIGHVARDNFISENNGLIKITAGAKAAAGGSIVMWGDIIGSTSKGFTITGGENVAYPYDLIDIRGKFEDSGVGINNTARVVRIDAIATDPNDYNNPANNLPKSRGVEIGRTMEIVDIKLVSQYGSHGLFLFAMNGASGTINLTALRLGYEDNGTKVTYAGNSGDLMICDTLGDNASINVQITAISCHEYYQMVTAEATPGPTNDCNFVVESRVGHIILGLPEDTGGTPGNLANFECYGNQAINSNCDIIATAPLATVSNCIIRNLRCARNTTFTGPNLPIPARGAMVRNTQVMESVDVELGTFTKFENCQLPRNWVFTGDGERIVLVFDNCDFPNDTQLEPTDYGDLRVGLSNKITGLSLELIPVQCLPYIRLDAIAHPRYQGMAQPMTSTLLETINRPIGWTTKGPILPFWTAGTIGAAAARDTFYNLLELDEETSPYNNYCVGGYTYPLVSSSATQGSFLYDLGFTNGTIETAITFRSGGALEAGLVARYLNNSEMMFAYLNQGTDQLIYRRADPNGANSGSYTVTGPGLVLDQEYILRMTLIGDTVTVYLDGTLRITDSTSVPNQAAQDYWGVRHRNGHLTGGTDNSATGPVYRYLEIRPNDNDAAVATERRKLS